MLHLRLKIARAISVVLLAALLAPGLASADLPDGKLTIDSNFGDLLDNPKSLAIIDRYLPGMSTNPQSEQGRFMSLREIAPYSAGKITEETLQAIEADLEKLNTPD